MKKGYVAFVLDDTIRLTSTSGGICQAIAQKFIKDGGYVSGVIFDDNFQLQRIVTRDIKFLPKINKSKYLQSNQGKSFQIIRNLLEKEKGVLFFGTPCQVAGLKTYLGREYNNLWTVDFVCLGVPSHLSWNRYKDEIENKASIVNVDFKDKRKGWKNFTFHVDFLDGSEINEPGRENYYMKSVISKWNSRPSCYECLFRSLDRVSDLTVADAWRTDSFAAELLDDNGTSSVMTNSEKGEELFDLIYDQLEYKEVDIDTLWAGNRSAFSEVSKPIERKYFYKVLNRFSYKTTCKIVRMLGKISRKIDRTIRS